MSGNDNGSPAPGPTKGKRTASFGLTGMTCASCAQTISESLSSLDGIDKADVNLATEKATVTYDPSRVNIEVMRKAVVEAGYDVIINEVTLSIGGMSCASCSSTVEEAVQELDGVLSAVVNLATEKLTVRYDPQRVRVPQMKKAITDAGYEVLESKDSDQEKEVRARELKRQKVLLISALSLAVPIMVFMLLMQFTSLGQVQFLMDWGNLILFIVATPVQFIIGYQFYSGTYKALRNRRANMDTLIAVGTSAAYFYSVAVTFFPSSFINPSVYFDTSTMIIALILFGKYLEAKAKSRTSEAIRRLIDLQAKTAVIIRDGAEVQIQADELDVSDLMVVGRGEDPDRWDGRGGHFLGRRIAADRREHAGVEVGELRGHRRDHQQERSAQGPGHPGGQGHRAGPDRAPGGERPGLEGTDPEAGRPGRGGVRASGHLDRHPHVPVLVLHRLRPVRSDPAAVHLLPHRVHFGDGHRMPVRARTGDPDGDHGGHRKGGGERHPDQEQRIAGDRRTHHRRGLRQDRDPHQGRAAGDRCGLVRHPRGGDGQTGRDRGEGFRTSAGGGPGPQGKENGELPDAEAFENVPGMGIRAVVEGREVLVGSRKLMASHSIEVHNVEATVVDFEARGRTAVMVACQGRAVGVIAVADVVKDSAKEAVEALRKMRIEVYMITGDNARTARAIGEQLGITNVLAEVLPEDKAKEVTKLQAEGKIVMMVGDGVNDAPALAQADVGVAIGSGTDVAMETGDVVLIKDDLKDVVATIQLSRQTMKKIRQNLFWAFGYNVAGIPIAAGLLFPFTGWLLSPIIAAGAMAMSSVSVVSNAALLKGYTPEIKRNR